MSDVVGRRVPRPATRRAATGRGTRRARHSRDRARPSTDPLAGLTADQAARWEDLLAYVTDPDRPRPLARDDTPRLLAHLLARAGVDESEFWALRAQPAQPGPARRLRAALARRAALELSAFDIGKLLKERFRSEPLTLGAAWHHGYFRSYFSHAAITHPANDGLREEFCTAWDIVRKQPAVAVPRRGRAAHGERLAELRSLRLDMPILVGPLPYRRGRGPGARLPARRSPPPTPASTCARAASS